MTSATTRPSRPGHRWITVIDGQRLRQLRRQHGLTQAALARQAAIRLPSYPA